MLSLCVSSCSCISTLPLPLYLPFLPFPPTARHCLLAARTVLSIVVASTHRGRSFPVFLLCGIHSIDASWASRRPLGHPFFLAKCYPHTSYCLPFDFPSIIYRDIALWLHRLVSNPLSSLVALSFWFFSATTIHRNKSVRTNGMWSVLGLGNESRSSVTRTTFLGRFLPTPSTVCLASSISRFPMIPCRPTVSIIFHLKDLKT